jgi:predicted transposase YdaD
MQESVIYQDILQKGEQRGLQKGEVAVILRLLIRRFGAIEPEIEQQIRALSITQLDELAEALLDFSSQSDLVNYLANISPAQPNQ